MRGRRRIEALLAALAIVGCSTTLVIDQGPRDGGTLPDGGLLPDGGTPPDGALRPAASVLASGLENADALAVDGKRVYFARKAGKGAILEVPTAGGVPVTKEESERTSFPFAVTVGGSGLYWIAAESGAVPPGIRLFGGPVAGTLQVPGGLAVTTTKVFWTYSSGTSNVIYSADPTLPLAVTNNVAAQPTFIVADASFVYYASVELAGHVYRSPQELSAPDVTVAPYDTITALALSPKLVAWASKNTVVRSSLDLKTVTIVSSVTDVVSIVIDDAADAVYFLTGSSPGLIYRQVTGVIPQLVPSPPCSRGRGLAQDADALYVACGDAILRIPKSPP